MGKTTIVDNFFITFPTKKAPPGKHSPEGLLMVFRGTVHYAFGGENA